MDESGVASWLHPTLPGGCRLLPSFGKNGFVLSKAKEEDTRCRFFDAPDGDGHLLSPSSSPLPSVRSRENLEFCTLMKQDRSQLAPVVYFDMVGVCLFGHLDG